MKIDYQFYLTPDKNYLTLELDIFSFSIHELNALPDYFIEMNISYQILDRRSDNYGRMGIKYLISDEHDIWMLTKNLNLKNPYLIEKGIHGPPDIIGTNYRCEEIITHGVREKRCISIYAESDKKAQIYCAIRAGEMDWYSAEALPGKCWKD